MLGPRCSQVLAAVFPLACPGCGVPAEPICDRCAEGLRPAPEVPAPAGVDAWFAAFSYEGVARELIARVKYRRSHAAIGWLADVMGSILPEPFPSGVTWAPTTPRRRRERGFDHAELLARALSRSLDLRTRRLLTRVPGPPQTGSAAPARRRGPRFEPRGSRGVNVDADVLLVDDVATTGATVAAAAAALRLGGAQRVVVVTAARTPAQWRRRRTTIDCSS